MIKHFKGLNTLRAIAAMAVVLGHIELIKKLNGLPNILDNRITVPNGHIAVVLFFVLSGFLITYLLLREERTTGMISLKNFYMRRVLRIWPVYYIVILLSWTLFSGSVGTTSAILSLTIFPNVAYAMDLAWPNSPHIWSIGVEEQFYFIWPFFVLFFRRKWLTGLLIIFIVGFSILPMAIDFVNTRTFQSEGISNFVFRFFYTSKFNSMGIGCLAGILLAEKSEWFHLFKNTAIAVSLTLIPFILWFSGFKVSLFNDEFYSLLFILLILSVTLNPKINIDTKVTTYLGKISYGIYMYHWIVILLILSLLPKDLIVSNSILFNLLFYLLTVCGTILIAGLSFTYFEGLFLKIKKRFESK